MIKYVFRDDVPLPIKGAKNADAQVIGEALEAIRVGAGGELEPGAVVDAARDEGHPLHVHFEWDDAAAAEAFRLDQARAIIRVVRVTDVDAVEGSTRAFVSIAGKGGVSYRSVGDVKTSKDLQAIVLAQAERDLEAFERRYRELRDICEIVASARQRVSQRRKNETRKAA